MRSGSPSGSLVLPKFVFLLAAGNITLWLRPDTRVSGTQFRLFDFGGTIAILGMTVMLLASAVAHTVRLYRLERITH